MKLVDLLNLILPSQCGVCDVPGTNLCASCLSSTQPEPHYFKRGSLPGFAAATYSKNLSKLLVAFKDKNQSALITDLQPWISVLGNEILKFDFDTFLVPAPSRGQNFAKRGFQPSLLIAQAVADLVPKSRVANCLALAPKTQDQVGLNPSSRFENLSGAMRLNQSVQGKTCLLIDDIVTTGATILEGWRVLQLGGAVVLGAYSICE